MVLRRNNSSINARWEDEFIRLAIDLQRVNASVRGVIVLPQLRDLRVDLTSKIIALGKGAEARRLQMILDQVNATIATAYERIGKTVNMELREVSDFAQDRTVQILNDGFDVDLAHPVFTRGDLSAIASDAMIQGHPTQAWWEKQSQDLRNRFTSELRAGYLQGETVPQLVERLTGPEISTVNGTRERVEGGVFPLAINQAEALVRTAVATVAGTVHENVFRGNGDLLRGFKHVSTLDSRTTKICMARDGCSWDMKNKPLPDSPHPLPFARPPLHFNCRSLLVPISKTWAELIADETGKKYANLPDVPEGTRASMNGQVPASLTYEAWLKTQPEEFQKEVLGLKRWQMWKTGKFSFASLIDQNGKAVTVAALRAKHGL